MKVWEYSGLPPSHRGGQWHLWGCCVNWLQDFKIFIQTAGWRYDYIKQPNYVWSAWIDSETANLKHWYAWDVYEKIKYLFMSWSMFFFVQPYTQSCHKQCWLQWCGPRGRAWRCLSTQLSDSHVEVRPSSFGAALFILMIRPTLKRKDSSSLLWLLATRQLLTQEDTAAAMAATTLRRPPSTSMCQVASDFSFHPSYCTSWIVVVKLLANWRWISSLQTFCSINAHRSTNTVCTIHDTFWKPCVESRWNGDSLPCDRPQRQRLSDSHWDQSGSGQCLWQQERFRWPLQRWHVCLQGPH